MIFRVIGESQDWRGQRAMMGACWGGLALYAWDDLYMPTLRNPRARFWFTEAGWHRYGQYVVGEAMHSGRTYRVIQRKNPPRSEIVYRDKWQVALLPRNRRH